MFPHRVLVEHAPIRLSMLRLPQLLHPCLDRIQIGIRVVTVESEHGPLEFVATNTRTTVGSQTFLEGKGRPGTSLANGQRWSHSAFRAISQPFGDYLSRMGSLSLLTPGGWHAFPIAGIYADYASTRGTVRISRDVYRQFWTDERINGLALFLNPGADADAVIADLRSKLASFPDLQVNPSGELRKSALDVFDRTFAITAAMQLITTLVAFIGVLSSLLALQLEKARELGILRALGFSLAELRSLTLWETGLLGRRQVCWHCQPVTSLPGS